MYLLDTGCLFLIAGIDQNNNVNTRSFETFIAKKDVAINIITIFELLNNPIAKRKYSQIINSVTEKTRSLSFLSASFYDSYLDVAILYNLESKSFKEQQEVRLALSVPIIEVYSYYYSNLLSLAIMSYFIPLMNFKDKGMIENDDYFKKETQERFLELETKIRDYLIIRLNEMIKNDCFFEKNRNMLIDSLFYALVYAYTTAYNKAVKSLNKNGWIDYQKLFNSIKLVTKHLRLLETNNQEERVPFETISLYSSLSNNLDVKSKKRLKQYIDIIVDNLSKNDSRISPLLNHLMRVHLKALLTEKTSSRNNDILDSMVADFISFFNSSIKFDGLITFDNKFASKVRAIYPNIEVLDESNFSK